MINCTVKEVSAGNFALDGGAMFGVVPKVVWQKTNPADDHNRISLAMRNLLIRHKDRVILVDVGVGDKYDQKFTNQYRIEGPSIGESLLEEQITPEMITDVIITHFHFDHAGGLTKAKPGHHPVRPNAWETVELVFPNAEVWAQKRNYDWACSPSEKDRASYFLENFLPIQKAGKLRLLEGDTQIWPGISVHPSDNHTVGHQVVRIDRGNGTPVIYYCADLIPTSHHLKIPFVMGYDLYPMQTMEDKKDLLHRVHEEKAILFFEHDPSTPSGQIRMEGQSIHFTSTDLEGNPL